MIAWPLVLHLGVGPPAVERPLLEWDAPEKCPDQRRVDARLEQLIPGERAESLVARGQVTRADERWHLRVELVSATGTSVRELDATSCAVLLEAAVFIVAVAIDPAVAVVAMTDDAGPREPEPPPEPEPPAAVVVPRQPARVEPTPTPKPPDEPRAPERARRIAGVLRAGFAVGTGEVSSLDLAPSLWAGIRGRYWRAELGARYVAGRPAPIKGGAELALDATGGVLRGCGVAPAGRRLELPICAGLDLAAVRGRPDGLAISHDQVALRVAVDLAVALAWPLTRRVALWVEATGGLAIRRPYFVAQDAMGPIEILGKVASFSALLGVELRFGRTR